MKKLIIALDGHSGCGKSSTAKAVAAKLNYAYLDTGAMYRSVTLYFIENQIDISKNEEVTQALQNIKIHFAYNAEKARHETFLNGKMVEDEIRKLYVANKVSPVSAISLVRQFLVAQQQEIGKQKNIVAEGRDIGTVVFPNAELKIFMTAQVKERATRRQKELQVKGETVELNAIIQNIEERDQIDSNREDSPLLKAEDAIIIDTTHLNFEEQVGKIITLAQAQQ
jgi:cytidylate kinase